MKKFFVLIKKEIREMLTLQVLAPMLITVLIFVFIGKVAGGAIEKAQKETDIAVMDIDKTVISKAIIENLSKSNFKIHQYNGTDESKVIDFAEDEKVNVVLIIPKEFGIKLASGEQQKVKTYAIFKNFSFTGSKDSAMLDSAISSLNSVAANQIIGEKVIGYNPEKLKNPIFLLV
jgi:ABC-2 type transport system permease protein